MTKREEPLQCASFKGWTCVALIPPDEQSHVPLLYIGLSSTWLRDVMCFPLSPVVLLSFWCSLHLQTPFHATFAIWGNKNTEPPNYFLLAPAGLPLSSPHFLLASQRKQVSVNNKTGRYLEALSPWLPGLSLLSPGPLRERSPLLVLSAILFLSLFANPPSRIRRWLPALVLLEGGSERPASVQGETSDLCVSAALRTNSKSTRKKRRQETTGCAGFAFSFCCNVIWSKCLSNVRVVFVNISYKCTKKRKLKSFMVVKSFTE